MVDRNTIYAIGECMLEFSGPPGTSVAMGYGGDTLNTCVYLSRLGIETAFVTAVGDDLVSEWMVRQWEEEGVETNFVVRLSNEKSGIYWIHVDDHGERSFTYWRAGSAASKLFDSPDRCADLALQLTGARLCYISGITLSILPEKARQALWNLLGLLKDSGVTICFDSNYRPVSWPSVRLAREVFDRTLTYVDIALPTFEDEAMLYGDPYPKDTAERLHKFGVPEVVIKMGERGCYLSDGSAFEMVTTKQKKHIVDTTAAGDAFNAGYLAARCRNNSVSDSALQGKVLAGVVIGHLGAIIPRTAIAP